MPVHVSRGETGVPRIFPPPSLASSSTTAGDDHGWCREQIELTASVVVAPVGMWGTRVCELSICPRAWGASKRSRGCFGLLFPIDERAVGVISGQAAGAMEDGEVIAIDGKTSRRGAGTHPSSLDHSCAWVDSGDVSVYGVHTSPSRRSQFPPITFRILVSGQPRRSMAIVRFG
jgi:hypothetical protein